MLRPTRIVSTRLAQGDSSRRSPRLAPKLARGAFSANDNCYTLPSHVDWQRVVRFKGENRVLVWTVSLIGLYPLLVGVTPNLNAILVWTALNGLLAPGLTVSHYPMLLKICPAEQRAFYLGIYSAVMVS